MSIPARVTGMLSGINRIRLEFKAIRNTDSDFRFVVLIESDWNLKVFEIRRRSASDGSINRIRLEFKDDNAGNN